MLFAQAHEKKSVDSPKLSPNSSAPLKNSASNNYSPLSCLTDVSQAIGNQSSEKTPNQVSRHHFEEIGIQTKTHISRVGDVNELEADRIAEQVINMPIFALDSYEGKLQGSKNGGQAIRPALPSVSKMPLSPRKESVEAPSSVNSVLKSSGQPLDMNTRKFFEPRFGFDFSSVRVHSGPAAENSANELNARAYTVGNDIVFGAGQFDSGTREGRRLIAHELVHTVQGYHGQIRRKPKNAQMKKTVSNEDVEFAKQKALEMAKLIKSNKWKPEYSDQLGHWLDFFQGSAWSYFVIELEDAIGERIEEYRGEGKKRTDVEGSSLQANLIVPKSKPEVVRGGFKVTYFAQIIDETSDSTSVEVYMDLVSSAGLSVETPTPVVKFKIGGEVKQGRKSSEKHEEKQARRKGKTVSRSFTIHRLGREVFSHQYLKNFYGAGPIAKKVTHERRGYGLETQYGYEIVPDEGGKPWGPFWNSYSDKGQDEGSQIPEIWRILYNEQRRLAEDLAFNISID